MKSLEKLEALAEKKRQAIHDKQQSLKKDMDALKDIEAEIDVLMGEEYRKDINKLNLTSEEFEKFRKCVLGNKSNLLEVIKLMSKEEQMREEGDKPLYE